MEGENGLVEKEHEHPTGRVGLDYSQTRTLLFFEMLCLYMNDVNLFSHLDGKVLGCDGFVIMEAQAPSV